MNLLYELYIRFMAWLEAALPERDEHLLSRKEASKKANLNLIKKLLGCLTSTLLVSILLVFLFSWGLWTVWLKSLKLPTTSFPLTLKWQTDLGGTTKWEPTYQDGLVLLPARNSFFISNWYALDASNGQIIWSSPTGKHNVLICLTSEYLVASNTETHVIPDGSSVSVLKTKTGELAWKRDDTLVIACSDKLILERGNRGWIAAMTIAGGQEVWGGTNPRKGFSGLQHVLYNPETNEFFIRETTLPWDYYFIDANSGYLRRFIEKTKIIPNASSEHELNSLMLLIDGEQIFMSVWPDKGNRLVAILDSKTGEVIHREDRYGDFYPQVVTTHTLYAYSRPIGVVALDRTSFDLKWKYPPPPGRIPWIPQGALSSFVSLGGVGYTIFSDATLRAIDLETGQELGYWQPETIDLPIGAKAGLAVSEKMLYVSFGDGKLYAFGR